MDTLSGHCIVLPLDSWSNRRGRSVPQIMCYLRHGENKKTKFNFRIFLGRQLNHVYHHFTYFSPSPYSGGEASVAPLNVALGHAGVRA